MSDYTFNTFVASVFFFLLWGIKDIPTDNMGTAFIIAFSMYPLYLAGKMGVVAIVGTCKITGELLNRYLRPQYRVKLPKVKMSAFVHAFLETCIHCLYAWVMANSYVYFYILSALFGEDKIIPESSTIHSWYFYTTVFTVRFFIMQINIYHNKKVVDALNAERNQQSGTNII